MDVIAYIGNAVIQTVVVVGVVVLVVTAYRVFMPNMKYRKAKKEIFAFVKEHKTKCTGNNRFVVTEESLQFSFREYDKQIILNVWLDLINEHVIVMDPEDQVWCIR